MRGWCTRSYPPPKYADTIDDPAAAAEKLSEALRRADAFVAGKRAVGGALGLPGWHGVAWRPRAGEGELV
ncbi:MAG: hypothetical protein ACR2GH_08080 [Pseudonocardia sp.]